MLWSIRPSWYSAIFRPAGSRLLETISSRSEAFGVSLGPLWICERVKLANALANAAPMITIYGLPPNRFQAETFLPRFFFRVGQSVGHREPDESSVGMPMAEGE
ncbi:hypothetical protein Sinac_5629 [Singulisphaera acidiphila DSM 18658]|uniref:Uncharacterized protein n=1 Tax=Singulisphaera acidiphila (strain ATCC BAA-1392 / DSM 18658 / VKM B-2454 / MOB10) TaxID=886293 RepID=L0DKH3_SINAD|nr:hypothetical protein Sinac_5629 [Singulisphaera acidiphila DSM 18658]